MRRAALAALTLAGAAGIPLAAQDLESLEGGRSLTGRISQSVEADSNYDLEDDSPGTSYYGDTRFALDFTNITPTQSLALGFDTGLRALWQAEEDFEVIAASPSLAYITYDQEGLDTGLDADFRVRSRQVDASSAGDIITDDPTTPVPDTLDQAAGDTRETRYDADVGFVLGRTSPSSYEFRLTGTAFDYSEDIGTGSLVPRRTVEGSATWTLRLTPVFSAALLGSYFYYDADDEAETEINAAEAEAGLVYQPDEILRLRGGIGYGTREREALDQRTGEREIIQDDSGLTARADVSYQLPSFVLIGNARWTAAAPESRLSGGMTAVYNLPRGQVIGRVYQNYVGGRGGDEERVTGASIGLVRDINSVSRVGLDLEYATQENQDDSDVPNIDRTDLTLSYAYDITERIDAEIGYRFRNRIEDPADADSHRVYFVLGRSFETGL